MFIKFPSLESFGHVWRNQCRMIDGPVIRYRDKIKLHGTNAGIRVDGHTVTAQKRTDDVFPSLDNAGFANWLEPFKNDWVFENDPGEVVTFFGEWAGPGVQKGDAVSLLDHKFFFIFAVQVGDNMIVEPEEIEELLPNGAAASDDVVVLPWGEVDIALDFSNITAADMHAEALTSLAEEIGVEDPFIKEMFGLSGPGEGVVMVPIMDNIPRDMYSALVFKVKAARHGAKKAKAASRKIEIPEGAKEFVEMFVTESRCMQALTEACEGIAEKPRTGDFLKWIGGDVKKESVVELEDAGLEWKSVAKLVNNHAANWFLNRCNRPLGEG